ncbi:Thioredoxin-like fold [Lasallia pustulata]|uniref:Thioredoxin-like fold n=1 Tax=Lasallia pustulata TaxID=136370 RepID=A0A1W5CVC6_9LECA|nr:Thioredoxin-like fold [Lasallia pustulata]
MAPPNNIIVFHYSFSPYARRVTWYLALRGIDYAQCLQPVTLPREDLSALGVKYRRIPVMSIGRDIYCDTRLILQKLEEKFPSGALGASQADQKAVERLLEKWTIDSGVFVRAAQTLPMEMPLFNDTKFTKDREDYSGTSWVKADIAKMRPEALAHVRDAFDLLETGLLADGREWVLKTERPSLADIEAVWPFHWLAGIQGALPPTIISAKQYPKVFAWIDRFQTAVSAARSSAPKPTTLKGADAVAQITQAEFSDPEGQVDENDPLSLKKDQDVERAERRQTRKSGFIFQEPTSELQQTKGKVCRSSDLRHNILV